MSVEEYRLDPISNKQGHINKGIADAMPQLPEENDDELDNVPEQTKRATASRDGKLERRHTLSSSFRFIRRHSKGLRLTLKHQGQSLDGGCSSTSPMTPTTPSAFSSQHPRRRSIAGTFITDPTLRLPPRPTQTPQQSTSPPSFVPDGVSKEDAETKSGNFSKVADSDYDPYSERIVDYPTTNTETLLHLLKGSLGTGILAMPNAFYHSGWALGIGGTIIIGMICTYCIHLLVTCEYELCRRRRVPALNYPSTAEAALLEGPTWMAKAAPYAPHVINFFLLAYQLGICCVYVVFVAENIKNVVDVYFQPMDVRIYMVIILLPLILINYVRNLKYMAPFSTVANIIMFIGFGITLYFVFQDIPSLSTRQPVGQVIDWPLFFGTVLFSLEAIGVIMPLENEMKTPKSFGGTFGVLNRAMISIIFLYVGMGFFGYLKYGKDAKGSITLNIPPEDVLAQVVKIMMAVAIFITHALQCYVAIDITWTGYLASRFEKNSHNLLIEFIVRTLLVLFTFLLAVAIPNLELFISLIGALCLAVLGIAVPAIIQQGTWWYQTSGRKFVMMSVKNTALCLFGLLGLVVGTYCSLRAIVEHFSSQKETV